MQRLTITLMNVYDAEPTVLDNLVLPSQINRDDFIGRLMIDIGESEVCITNPRIMKIAIGAWSRGKLPVWNKLAAILDYDYNPIWNVDGETVHTGSNSGSRNYGRTRGEERTIGEETENTTTGQISADNAETWSNDTKTDFEESKDTTDNLSETIADTESSNASDTWTEKRTGNIGVTTTQKMMEEEKAFWERYDIIGYIINQFAKEFCLMVY